MRKTIGRTQTINAGNHGGIQSGLHMGAEHALKGLQQLLSGEHHSSSSAQLNQPDQTKKTSKVRNVTKILALMPLKSNVHDVSSWYQAVMFTKGTRRSENKQRRASLGYLFDHSKYG